MRSSAGSGSPSILLWSCFYNPRQPSAVNCEHSCRRARNSPSPDSHMGHCGNGLHGYDGFLTLQELTSRRLLWLIRLWWTMDIGNPLNFLAQSRKRQHANAQLLEKKHAERTEGSFTWSRILEKISFYLQTRRSLSSGWDRRPTASGFLSSSISRKTTVSEKIWRQSMADSLFREEIKFKAPVLLITTAPLRSCSIDKIQTVEFDRFEQAMDRIYAENGSSCTNHPQSCDSISEASE